MTNSTSVTVFTQKNMFESWHLGRFEIHLTPGNLSSARFEKVAGFLKLLERRAELPTRLQRPSA